MVVVIALVCALPVFGILAAIAIPNFLRYQLRAKQAAVTTELRDLVNAEAKRVNSGQGLREIGVFAAAPLGGEKRALSSEEQALAAELGWKVGPATWGQYRMATVSDDAGNRAVSFCAEMDLDEDGHHAALVGFLPVLDAGGAVMLEPPPPPCSSSALIGEQGAHYRPEWQGKLMGVSPPNVF
jgi:hypothetical protein